MSATPDPQERRLTPTERLYELAMAQATRAPAPPEHDLELTRNAKGDVQIALKVRGHDLAKVTDDAISTFAALCRLYPRAEGAAS